MITCIHTNKVTKVVVLCVVLAWVTNGGGWLVYFLHSLLPTPTTHFTFQTCECHLITSLVKAEMKKRKSGGGGLGLVINIIDGTCKFLHFCGGGGGCHAWIMSALIKYGMLYLLGCLWRGAWGILRRWNFTPLTLLTICHFTVLLWMRRRRIEKDKLIFFTGCIIFLLLFCLL